MGLLAESWLTLLIFFLAGLGVAWLIWARKAS